MADSVNSKNRTYSSQQKHTHPFISFLITFIIMFISWIVLSGKFDPLLIGLGLFSSLTVAYLFHDLLVPSFETSDAGIFFRFIQYIPWLMYEIIKANFHMLYLVFHPNMERLLDPTIIKFKTKFKSDVAITTLANSITLTPGTITVNIDSDGVFSVHAIDRATAKACPGEMLKKVAHIFGEEI